MIEQAPAMVGAGFEDLGVKVQVEGVFRDQAGLLHGPQLHGIQEHAAIARRADEDRNGAAVTGGKQAGRDAVPFLLRGVVFAQQVTKLGAGHLPLELGTGEDGADEAVLIEQHAFVEGHVGDPDGAFGAQRGVVGEDRDLVDGAGFVGVQAAVAVVVADGVGGAQVRHPAGFEQRDQPRVMLARNGDGAGDGERQRTSRADGAVEDLVDAAQVGAAERRQAMGEQLVERVALVDAADVDVAAGATRGRFR